MVTEDVLNTNSEESTVRKGHSFDREGETDLMHKGSRHDLLYPAVEVRKLRLKRGR